MALLIGTACGLFMGTLFTMVWAVALATPGRLPARGPRVLVRAPGSMSMAVLLPLVVMGGWGIVGGFLGALYLAVNEIAPRDGFGSPNGVFTIAVCLFTVNALILGALWTRRKAWWEGYGVGLAFVGVFGWLMPWLAD